MGQFRVPIEIANPANGQFTPIEALVDTGAYFTMLPASLLESLGMSPSREMAFRLADGSSKRWGVAPALFPRLAGSRRIRTLSLASKARSSWVR